MGVGGRLVKSDFISPLGPSSRIGLSSRSSVAIYPLIAATILGSAARQHTHSNRSNLCDPAESNLNVACILSLKSTVETSFTWKQVRARDYQLATVLKRNWGEKLVWDVLFEEDKISRSLFTPYLIFPLCGDS